LTKIILAAGALKGSLSASAAADAMARGLTTSGFDATLIKLPIADGGDGTLDAFLSAGGSRTPVRVHDPLGHAINADFGLLDDGTAVIEMALASGLARIDPVQVNPNSALIASTFGTGELIRAALDHGAKRIIIGLGGSATTDGGAGCLAALGIRFLDVQGRAIAQFGGGFLDQVSKIDLDGLDPRARGTEWIIATDVQNPAIGEQGAARVFAPQKGAFDHATVERLENNLRHFFDLVKHTTSVDVSQIPGGGAAGAFAAGLLAFLPARIASGIDLLLDHVSFDVHLADANLVITSEGRIDAQTLGGKAPLGVARRAAARGVPTIALVGGLSGDSAVLVEQGIIPFPITSAPMSLQDAVRDADTLVASAAQRLGYLLKLTKWDG